MHRVRQNVTSEGQQKGQRVSGIGNCVPDNAGELEAGHAKAAQTRGRNMGIVLLAGKEWDGGVFPPLRKKWQFLR